MKKVLPSIHPVLILRFGLADSSLTDIAIGGHIFQFLFQGLDNFFALLFRKNIGRI